MRKKARPPPGGRAALASGGRIGPEMLVRVDLVRADTEAERIGLEHVDPWVGLRTALGGLSADGRSLDVRADAGLGGPAAQVGEAPALEPELDPALLHEE